MEISEVRLRCNAGSEGEAEQIDGSCCGQKRAEGGIGSVGVLVEIARGRGAGALAEAGVVEEERGDIVLGEQALRGLPVVQLVPDAVKEKDGGRRRGRGDVDGFEGAVVVGNGYGLEGDTGGERRCCCTADVLSVGGHDGFVAQENGAPGQRDGDAEALGGERDID